MQAMILRVLSSSNEQDLVFDPDKNLAQNLFGHGFLSNTFLCSGLGLCGQCSLRIYSGAPQPSHRDREYFSQDELSQGWRLGCAHYPVPGLSLEVPARESRSEFSWQAVSQPSALGVDIGTTTLKWGFVHPGGELSPGWSVNPQMGAGSEIMSRLAFAYESRDNYLLLQEVLLRELNRILDLSPSVPLVAVTGNPAVIHILLGEDISGLIRYPYRLAWTGGEHVLLPGIGREVFIPPLLSPFIGADISSGIVYLAHGESTEFPFLFCDLGTNGEMVLATAPEKFYSTSVALGPALEGVGLRFGSPFGPGIASGFQLSPQGILPDVPDWNGLVSGSGYLSLLGILRKTGVMDPGGQLSPGAGPMARTVDLRQGKVFLRDRFYLSGRDVEEILKVKAAFTMGVDYLLQKTSMTVPDLSRIYLAGALGEHFRLQDLDVLGFLPKGAVQKCRILGNASLKGALVLARDAAAREWAGDLPQKVRDMALAEDREYVNANFFRHMRFEYPGSG